MNVIIDTRALGSMVNILQEMHKSAFPVVIRQTLNKAAYDVKQVTMPETSDVFIHRKPTFFKANSKVVQAQGFHINDMAATIGFIPKPDAHDTSVSDLEEQENSGDISGRAFIPTAENRVNNSWSGNVRAAGRWRNVQNKIVDSSKSSAKNPAGQFRSSAAYGGVGSLVIGSKVNANGNRMVWRIDEIPKDWKEKIKKKALFVVKAGRQVTPEATHFMRKASLQSGNKMDGYFMALAEAKMAQLAAKMKK